MGRNWLIFSGHPKSRPSSQSHLCLSESSAVKCLLAPKVNAVWGQGGWHTRGSSVSTTWHSPIPSRGLYLSECHGPWSWAPFQIQRLHFLALIWKWKAYRPIHCKCPDLTQVNPAHSLMDASPNWQGLSWAKLLRTLNYFSVTCSSKHPDTHKKKTHFSLIN